MTMMAGLISDGLAGPTVSASTLKTGLISFWEFENTSWTDAVTATGNDLTGSGTPTTTPAVVGNGVHLVAASSQFLFHASNSSLQVGGQDWSISAWVNLNSFLALNEIISKKGAFGNREYALITDFDTSNKFVATVLTNSGGTLNSLVASTFGTISTGTKYFVVMTYNNATNTLAISVNGGAFDTMVVSLPPIASSTAQFRIGTNDDSSGNGFTDANYVDQVGFWKKVLTGTEVTQLYNGGNGLSYAAM